MKTYQLLLITVIVSLYCELLEGYNYEYIKEQIWLEHGSICKKGYGIEYRCIHSSNCMYYGEQEGRSEFCDFYGGYMRMCCVRNRPDNIYSVKETESGNTNLREQGNQNIGNSGNVLNRQPGGGRGEIGGGIGGGVREQDNRNIGNLGNVQNRQPGGGGGFGGGGFGGGIGGGRIPAQLGPSSQSSVARNVTVNLPFVRPTLEDSISLRVCKKYFQRVHKIPVVGGRNALPGEFPHMTLLGYGPSNNIQWRCGGSLISERFVLTAAHCRSFGHFGRVSFVRLGEFDVRIPVNESETKTLAVEAFIPHPAYSFRAKYHDIALVKMNESILWTKKIFPACLSFTWDLSDIQLTVTGWGLTENLGDFANILQAGDLTYVSNERCRQTYGIRNDLREGIVETLHICADGGSERIDACGGDSGGPLQFNNTFYEGFRFIEIAGVVAFGANCGLVAGVYTRVLPYVPWIEGIVWPDG